MTKNYKNVVVPIEVYEFISDEAHRRRVSRSHFLRGLVQLYKDLTHSKKRSAKRG